MAPWLLPDGYGRPALAALLREGSVVTEAGRLVARRGAARRAVRRAPYGARNAARAAEPVLLIPGFLAGDWTLREMSKDLRARGFHTYRSHIHANILVNLGGATATDVRELIAIAQKAVFEKFGHRLEPEIGFIGEF